MKTICKPNSELFETYCSQFKGLISKLGNYALAPPFDANQRLLWDLYFISCQKISLFQSKDIFIILYKCLQWGWHTNNPHHSTKHLPFELIGTPNVSLHVVLSVASLNGLDEGFWASSKVLQPSLNPSLGDIFSTQRVRLSQVRSDWVQFAEIGWVEEFQALA